MVVGLTRCSAAQEHHRELYSHHSPSLRTLQTFSTSQSPVICRNTLTDDSAVVGCISDGPETEYQELVDHFVREQSSHVKCRQGKVDNCGFKEDQEQFKEHFHQGRSSGDSGIS